MPFELTGWAGSLAALAVGFGFGFVLEQGGLADSRRLAAQFYGRDLRVLKVMFTAIVVAMVGVYLLAGLGWVDLTRIDVNPTNLWPGIVGGLLLGAGFIIGGYCPGTSLLAAATLKLDAIAFVLGVLLGVTVFAETVDGFQAWYESSGAFGRLTLPELFGWGAPWVVLAAVALALGAFWLGERVEDHLGDEGRARSPRALPVLSGALGLGVLALLAVGPPRPAQRALRMRPALSAALAAREVQLDPAELLELLHDRRLALRLIDVRPEAEFNLFHLRGAERRTLEELADPATALPTDALYVVVATDEAGAEPAWELLRARGARRSYLLAGGVNLWLDRYLGGARATPAPGRLDPQPRHAFPRALGERWPASRPPLEAAARQSFERRVKDLAPAPQGGGCG